MKNVDTFKTKKNLQYNALNDELTQALTAWQTST